MCYADLIGKKYERGARGPEAFDCWGLVMEMARRKGLGELPDYEVPDRSELYKFVCHEAPNYSQVKKPMANCIVLFRLGREAHVGWLLGHGRFIHASEDLGQVVVDELSIWNKRVLGFYEYS